MLGVERTFDRRHALGQDPSLAARAAHPAALINLQSIALMGGEEDEGFEARSALALDVSHLVPAVHTAQLRMHDHVLSFPVAILPAPRFVKIVRELRNLVVRRSQSLPGLSSHPPLACDL